MLSGICTCGHVDAGHFDEVGPCTRSGCTCERFKDKDFVRCVAREPVQGFLTCTLQLGHEGDHAARRLDGTLVRGWAA